MEFGSFPFSVKMVLNNIGEDLNLHACHPPKNAWPETLQEFVKAPLPFPYPHKRVHSLLKTSEGQGYKFPKYSTRRNHKKRKPWLR